MAAAAAAAEWADVRSHVAWLMTQRTKGHAHLTRDRYGRQGEGAGKVAPHWHRLAAPEVDDALESASSGRGCIFAAVPLPSLPLPLPLVVATMRVS